MNDNLKNNVEENEVIETVELTITPLKEGTIISLSDPSGFDQSPVPEIISLSDNYYIDTVRDNDSERLEAYWKTYNTLEFYNNEKVIAGNAYTVFGKVKAKPGYIFYDPVNLIINGQEVSSLQVEDYSLELDSFYFYFDVEAVKV